VKQFETDIAVVAAGTAGLAAAVAAVEKGVRVMVLEKASTPGGAGNMARGPFAVESRLQRLKKIMITREEAFKFHMEYTHWRVDARLVSEYINKSASTIDWLEKMGVEFDDVQSHTHAAKFVWHTIKGPLEPREIPGTGIVMIKILTDRAKKLGARFFFRTPVKKILKKGNKIVGIIAEDESGEDIQVNAKAVIVATGGLSSQMVPTVTGDGIRMAWEAGAGHTEITGAPPQDGEDPQDKGGVPSSNMQELGPLIEVVYAFRQPHLMVNLSGERFMDEEIAQVTPYGNNPLLKQKKRTAFAIFDENTKQDYIEKGLDLLPGNLIADPPLEKLNNFEKEFDRAIELAGDTYFKLDSLEELAAKTGINRDNLLKTIAEYNHACETGRDHHFSKNPRYLRPVQRPKFYVYKQLGGGAISVAGGIQINYKTEVLDKNMDVIPGFYAAGNDANSIYGDTYIYYMSGNYLGFALNSGRMAGENAADFAKSTEC